jgi:hypothetical protein
MLKTSGPRKKPRGLAHRHKVCCWYSSLSVPLLIFLSLLTMFSHSGRSAVYPDHDRDFSVQSRLQFIIADFDGDGRPDSASVQTVQTSLSGSRYLINFQLASGLRHSVPVTADVGGLRLRSMDVNNDEYPDLVVTSFWTGQPVAVFLNDRHGLFARVEPSSLPGAFVSSENSLNSKTDAPNDRTAALLSHWSPDDKCVGTPSLPSVVGFVVTDNLYIFAWSVGDSFFGRAPPSEALHPQETA